MTNAYFFAVKISSFRLRRNELYEVTSAEFEAVDVCRLVRCSMDLLHFTLSGWALSSMKPQDSQHNRSTRYQEHVIHDDNLQCE